jgi:hypothetical protein
MTIMQKSTMTTSKDSIGTSLKVLESVNIAGALNVRENLETAKPDILLEPIVSAGLLEFSKTDKLIEQGRKIAIEILPQVKSWF